MLIDSDAAIDAAIEGAEADGNYSLEREESIEEYVMRVPGVDAVPVEWLEYMQQECLSENDRTMVNAIEAILIEWHLYVHRLREMDRQREQEAKDGKAD